MEPTYGAGTAGSPIDGLEFQLGDSVTVGTSAGLADDRILAELLRLPPYDGVNVYKAIVPYTVTPAMAANVGIGSPANSPVVVPNGATGSVLVNPFRAVVGSRNAPAAAPSPNTASVVNSALANFRDIRSAIWTGFTNALTQSYSLAANSSGNPRWDLVYALVQPDVAYNSVTRRVKNPSTGNILAQAVPQYLQTTVTVAVVTGTPAASPTVPALTVDSAGSYYIPLAAVRVPTGFGGGSTVATTDIRPYTFDNSVATSRFVALSSALHVEPATGNCDTSNAVWAGASGAQTFIGNAGRPGAFLPPDFVGGRIILVELDLSNASSAQWSHQTAGIVDNSTNWKGRLFFTLAQASGTYKFANDTIGNGGAFLSVPMSSNIAGFSTNTQLGNSCLSDNTWTTGSTVSTQNNAINPQVNAGAVVALYVDASGVLRVYISGSPLSRVFFWIFATSPFPNL